MTFRSRPVRRRSHRSSSRKSWPKLLLALLGIGVVLGVLLYAWFTWALQPINKHSEVREDVKIEDGATVTQIAQMLEDRELIRSALAFRLYVKREGMDGLLQAGRFIIRRSQSVPEVAKVLLAGKADEVVVTIPEGYTVKDIDSLLTEKGLITEGRLIECAQRCDFSSFDFLPNRSDLAKRGGKLEGYLYPDTYFVITDEFVPKFFLERMLGTFRKRVVNPYQDSIANSGRSLHDIVTMASLVEEESRKGEERKVVAGILWKRLENDVSLGVDATVRYILSKPSSAITKLDLQIDSSYNTRKFEGLPPGPIASPSLEALEATINPVTTPYWYYLHDNSGQIHYSKTNHEHNQKRWKYLQ